jgi:tetratricopeptide (TPR) repeat protein
LGKTLSTVRQATGLKDALSPTLRSVDARGDERQKVMAHIHAARALGSVNLFDEAYEALAIADPDQLEDDDLKRASLAADAQLASRQGLFVRAVAAGDRLEAMGPVEDPEWLFTLTLARTMGGQAEAALQLLERLDAAAPATDAAERVAREKLRGLIHFNARDFDAAARAAQKLTQTARSAGLRFDIAAALHNLGDSCDRLGDHPRAYAAFVESLELTSQLEHERLSNLNRMHLCLLDGLRSAEGAEQRLKALIRRADGQGWLWDVLEGRFLLARLVAARGDHQLAREQLQTIIEKADEQGHQLIKNDARELLGKLEA